MNENRLISKGADEESRAGEIFAVKYGDIGLIASLPSFVDQSGRCFLQGFR